MTSSLSVPNSFTAGTKAKAMKNVRGLGSEVVHLLLRLGFDELDLYRIWGARSPDNEASARLMTKIGMVEEGTIRGHIRVRDGYRDSVVHSILRPQWTAITM